MSQSRGPREDIHPVFQSSHASLRRLIHLIPDELAEAVPEHPLFSLAKTEHPRDGFTDVSASCFANAINRAAWWLSESLGQPSNFDTVAYIGSNDIRYLLFMFAAIKVGYKMLFTSPRNNLDGHLNVLEKSDCQIFLAASDLNTNVQPILEQRQMRTLVVPKLNELLDSSPVPVYPYTKLFDDALHDPCLVLHTTGSTGLPKPIVWKNGMLTTYEAWRLVPPIDGYVPTTDIYQEATRAYTSMPLFHTSGINAAITWALCLGVTLVYGDPHVPPNAAYVAKMHQYAGVDATMGAPSIYEDLSGHPEWLDGLKRMHYVIASGAPLSHKAGNIISKYSRVIGNLGATETANLPRLAPAPEDWEYFYWHPTHSGIELRPDPEIDSGLHELFIVRGGPELKPFQGVFFAFPELHEWSMNDLYDRHPTKPFLWRYRGRKDDVIVLSNGEKITPPLMETALSSSPLVRGAMVVGQRQFQPMALIELNMDVPAPTNQHDREELIRKLRPSIEAANKHAPGHAQLDHHHILFADPSKPIHYLGQGKIQRRRTYQIYENDIIAAYRTIGEVNTGATPQLEFSSYDETVVWLRHLIVELSGPELKPNDDFFRAGIDSLLVMKMAREIGAVSASDIYQHHTLESLASLLTQRRRSSSTESESTSEGTAPTEASTVDIDEMRALLKSCVADLPRLIHNRKPMTVLLTGSTGSLGSYILETLYNTAHIEQIICLNRAANGEDRQAEVARKRGLHSSWNRKRVSFLQADLSAPFLGLAPPTYQNLIDSVTHIIHNQWPVNFNWHVASFDPFIRGVRNLVDLCLGSVHSAVLLFVSSVSAVGAWSEPGPVPENTVFDLGCASMGYGQAKLVSECLLEEAAAVSGLKAAVCRVGIVAGPIERKQGMWNRHEYIPALINSSVHLGCFPNSFPSRDNVDWIPVDKAARVLVEILDSSTSKLDSLAKGLLPVYHVANPHGITWSNLVPWATESLNIKPVSFEEWLQRLEDCKDELQDIEKNPAIKLVEFYRKASKSNAARRMMTWRAAEASKTLREMGPVNRQWIAAWTEQWGL
ncbi:acetyl-CoA synthetase-like protein [Xylariaceae sp. FL1651]|nr:acetyl-CoA synthetase-like protein [Xylariaceae sp. FL1651]